MADPESEPDPGAEDETIVGQPDLSHRTGGEGRSRGLPARGDLVGRYRVVRRIGSGGMGTVFEALTLPGARGVPVDTRVALKIVHPHLLDRPGYFQRFLREADLGRAIRHPNVVRTLDCDAIGGLHFLVMQHVEGQTLRALLEELGRVPEELCRHVAEEVARALAAVHAAGVVHRDVKPENVLLTPQHEVRLMDLGVARLVGEAVRLSQSGAFVGSLHYAAPESLRKGGSDVDGRADLHGLGVVLYELATGVNPYRSDDINQTVTRILRHPPRRVSELNAQLSPFFEQVVHALLEKSPDVRPASAEELTRILQAGEGSSWWSERTGGETTALPRRRMALARDTAVHGRDAELGRLHAMFDDVRAGRGAVLLLEGEAGVGKSRLVDEFVARVRSRGERTAFLFGGYAPGGAGAAAGPWADAFRAELGGDVARAVASRAPGLAAHFEALLRRDAPPSGTPPLTKSSLHACFVHAVRGVAESGPVVLLIDDLHFAPDGGRELFTALAMAVRAHPVLLVGTVRPSVPADWVSSITRMGHARHMRLDRLGAKDLIELLGEALGSTALASTLGARIALKSDGNPFFAFEIVRGLRDAGALERAPDGTWTSTRVIDDLLIPSSVLDVVNARVAELSEEDRDLLDVAACAGYRFDATLVGSVCGLGRVPALKRFGQLERRHRIVRSAGREFVFDHHQVQEALYRSLSEPLREEYHAALADALRARLGDDPSEVRGAQAVDLCRHALAGGRPRDALPYLDRALDRLAADHAHEGVVALLTPALAVPGLLGPADRCRLLLRKNEHLEIAGDVDEQDAILAEAERLAGEGGEAVLAARVRLAVGRAALRRGDHDEAGAAFHAAREGFRDAALAEDESTALGYLGLSAFTQGRYDEATARYEEQLALSEREGDSVGAATATARLGQVQLDQGRLDVAEERFVRALDLSASAGDRRGEASCWANLGVVSNARGRPARAEERMHKALEICRELGDRRGEANALGSIGGILTRRGRHGEARECFVEHLSVSRDISDRWGRVDRARKPRRDVSADGAARRGANAHDERARAGPRARQPAHRGLLAARAGRHRGGGRRRRRGARAADRGRGVATLDLVRARARRFADPARFAARRGGRGRRGAGVPGRGARGGAGARLRGRRGRGWVRARSPRLEGVGRAERAGRAK